MHLFTGATFPWGDVMSKHLFAAASALASCVIVLTACTPSKPDVVQPSSAPTIAPSKVLGSAPDGPPNKCPVREPLPTQECPPAPVDSLNTHAEHQCGEIKLTVWDAKDYEDGHVVVHFMDADGKALRPSLQWPGHFVSLCKQSLFALVDDSWHYDTAPSFIMDTKANMVARIEPGFPAEAAASDDHKILWVQGATSWKDRPDMRLKVYDLKGTLLFDKTYYEEGFVQDVTVEGITYRIPVRSPAWAS